ncbi:hypothetical protein B4168_0794 [Anoxybacillus flavithermus]|nr:hypothetical protein B4168_0794 [Anoxybacillus flavithermus]
MPGKQMNKHARENVLCSGGCRKRCNSADSGACLEKTPIFLLDKRNSVTATLSFTYYMVNNTHPVVQV